LLFGRNLGMIVLEDLTYPVEISCFIYLRHRTGRRGRFVFLTGPERKSKTEEQA
jgi:hypothetical protein